MQNHTEANPPGLRIAQGQLREKIREVRKSALLSGALQPIKTRIVHAQDQGVEFAIHQLDSLKKKHEASLAQKRLKQAASRETNPFLPYDKDLYVGDLSDSHVAVLNKFYVVPDHLLMITRSFVPQETLLEARDMEAAWRCLREMDSLVFYNGGVVGGASQAHRHLQLIPLPMEPRTRGFPTRDLLMAGQDQSPSRPKVPFVYAAADLSEIATQAEKDPKEAAENTTGIYLQLLAKVGLEAQKDSRQQAGPYNMLMTRRLMVIVPRSKEQVLGISINALGYAGSLLVRDEDGLERLLALGPMHALTQVGISGQVRSS